MACTGILSRVKFLVTRACKDARRARFAGVGWTFSTRVLPYPVPLWLNCSWGILILVALLTLFNAVFFIGTMERLLTEDEMGLRLIGVTFGRLAQINVALLFLPVTQNSLIALVTGSSFERIIRLHRWLGRWTFSLVHLHLLFLFLSWCVSGDFWDDLVENLVKDWHVVMGEMAYICLVLIVITSFFLVRRKLFNLFYASHVVLFPLFLVFLFLHFQPLLLLYYLSIPGVLYLADIVIRASTTFLNHGEVVSATVIGENTVEIVCETWRRVPCGPGQYIFMRIPRFSLEAHPFSVYCYEPAMNDGETGTALVSMGEQGDIGVATSTRDRITFLVKANGSYTKKLLDTAGTLTGRKVFLNGPYGRSWLAVEDYSNVLCIAGGVGITAILPFAELAVAAGKAAPKNVRLAWSSRSQELISHLEERLTRLKSAGCECDIHCTADSQTMDLAGEEGGGALIDNGRIDLDSVFEKCKEEAFGGKDTLFPSVAVFCCGPPGLSTALTNLCRKYSSLQVSFQLHDETFFL